MLSILTWPFRLVASCFSSAVIGCLAPLIIAATIGAVGVAYAAGILPSGVSNALRDTVGEVGARTGQLIVETATGVPLRGVELRGSTLVLTITDESERATREELLPRFMAIADRLNTPLFAIANGTIRTMVLIGVDATGAERYEARLNLADLAEERPESRIEISR
jgi:hypothetical protein